MSTSLFWSFMDRAFHGSGRVAIAFIVSVVICLSIGIGGYLKSRHAKGDIYRKEAIAIVGLSWIVIGLLGSLPFIFSGVLNIQYDYTFAVVCAAIFESVSGFTTTGASIFIEPELLPRPILYWRSLTHWLGGMGIVVLFVAVLGGTGTSGKYMVNSEVTGPQPESVKPRVRQNALLLWRIYLSFSAALCIILMLQGMTPFDSLCHTFGTVATAGFSTQNGSIGQYGNFSFEFTIFIFMILGGINFNLHASILQGRWKNVIKNNELRLFLIIILVATIVISLDLFLNRPTYKLAEAIRSAGFQVVAILTTTGFTSDDYNTWPTLSKWLLIVMMFVGGCAGSTAGGIKLMRLMIFIKVALQEVERTFRPHVVRTLRVNGQNIDDDVRRNVSAYVGHIMVIFFTSTIFLLLIQNESLVADQNKLDLESAFSAVVSTLNNIGPGIGMVGATENYSFFNPPAKLFLSLLMIIGRLEVMVLLCLFIPGFWRSD